MFTTSRNEDRETRPGHVGNGFPSNRPIPTSDPTEQPIEANPDPARMADMIGRRDSDGGEAPSAPGDADPVTEVAALIPDGRTPPPPTNGSAPLSVARSDDSKWRASVERLQQRPGWHGVMTPQPVTEAWAALQDALQAAQAEHHAVHGVNVEEAAHGRAATEAIRTAARDGEPAPKSKAARDWDADRARHRATAAGLLDRAVVARSAYDEAVTEALPTWRVELAAQVQPQHQKAANALGSALREYGNLVGLIDAAQQQVRAEGMDWLPLPQFGPGREGITKALGILGQLDSSQPLTAPKLTPSRAERHAMATMGDLHTLHALRRVEVREEYAYTSHTRGLLLEQLPPGMDL